eukprot:TRINITY_DN4119_c0_g3_i1.p1 TRINITY_DN4119_c0_g3~~TRINITY_DN4119_c0_g3_i1.p1  ORF type:complete len:1259 (+),score=239.54 TRINITY_DN4119_c0_g3_i1:38-3814(+)
MSTECIRVAVRVRPLNELELKSGSEHAVTVLEDGQTVQVKIGPGERQQEGTKNFTFDYTFSSIDPSSSHYASQAKVFSELGADLLTSALDGYNSCLFAYGQTGSGKSYTMMGYPNDPGVILRAVEDLFAKRNACQQSQDGGEIRVWVSFVEIYNEQLRDLLDPGRPGSTGGEPQNLRIMDHPELGTIVPGLVEAPCQTARDARKLIKFGLRKRVTSATVMNGASSRSHAVFTLKVQRLLGHGKDGGQEAMTARINLVDLAGSERHKSMHDGTTFREGCAINQSLSALALVIKELSEAQTQRLKRMKSKDAVLAVAQQHLQNGITQCTSKEVVPFRSSKLTFLLRDSLAGNSRTRMVAAVSPSSCNVEETLSTIRFATSVKQVRTVRVQNVEQKKNVVGRLQAEIRRLKTVLAGRGMEVDALGVGEVQEEIVARERLLQQMKKSYDLQLEEAAMLENTRTEVLQQQGLSCAEIDEVFGIEKDTPYLLNMSDDPSLSGCLMYFLRSGKSTSIGRHVENDIVLEGLGIKDFLCSIRNEDQRKLSISLPSQDVTAKPRVGVNGALLKREEGNSHQLSHNDRIIFGRAYAMRLVVPLEQQALAASTTPKGPGQVERRLSRGNLVGPDYEQEMLNLLIQEESEAWNELSLYFSDLRERLGEENSNEFFKHLGEAAYVVDEANEITAELRPEDKLKFEVELLWDIHRDISDIILIRVKQFPNTESGTQDAVILSYWTLASFKERLDMMRDSYCSYTRRGFWKGKGNPLEDPWLDPSTVELSLQMHQKAEAELQREDLRLSLLGQTSAESKSERLHSSRSPSRSQRMTSPLSSRGRRTISPRMTKSLQTTPMTTPMTSPLCSPRQSSSPKTRRVAYREVREVECAAPRTSRTNRHVSILSAASARSRSLASSEARSPAWSEKSLLGTSTFQGSFPFKASTSRGSSKQSSRAPSKMSAASSKSAKSILKASKTPPTPPVAETLTLDNDDDDDDHDDEDIHSSTTGSRTMSKMPNSSSDDTLGACSISQAAYSVLAPNSTLMASSTASTTLAPMQVPDEIPPVVADNNTSTMAMTNGTNLLMTEASTDRELPATSNMIDAARAPERPDGICTEPSLASANRGNDQELPALLTSQVTKFNDSTLLLLKQRLKDKEELEQSYKDRIASLNEELQRLEGIHGPLQELLGGAGCDAPISSAGRSCFKEAFEPITKLAGVARGKFTPRSPPSFTVPSTTPRSCNYVVSPLLRTPMGTASWPQQSPGPEYSSYR